MTEKCDGDDEDGWGPVVVRLVDALGAEEEGWRCADDMSCCGGVAERET